MLNSNRRNYLRAVMLLLIFGVAQAGLSVAKPAPLAGRLKTRGDKPVVVNGNKVKAGHTIFSGARIQSPEGVGVTVDLGSLGRLDIAPNTDLTLTFVEGNVDIQLKSGYVVLTTRKGVNGTVTTSEGQVVKTDPSRLSSVVARTAGSLGPEASVPIGAVGGGIGAGTARTVGSVGASIVSGAVAGRVSERGASLSPVSPRSPQEGPVSTRRRTSDKQ